MGNMLNALKRIESSKLQGSEPAHADPAGEAVAETGVATTETLAVAEDANRAVFSETLALPRDPAAMEALLATAELATAEALQDGVAAHSPAPRQSDNLTDPLGHLADAVLRSMGPGKPASLLFVSPDADNLGIDLLVPLATSLAQRLDSDLLLIDTHLRHPVLATRLGVETSRGLTDVLTGCARWPDVVRHTVLPGVDLLPAVPFSTPAGPPLGRLNLSQLLSEVRASYPLCLIHGASLRYPEVAPLASHCEGVYLVVRLHATMRRAASEAVPLLQRAGANVLGCIVVQ